MLAEAASIAIHVIETTSEYVSLRPLNLGKVRREHVREPSPTWIASEVAGFVHQNTVAEVRVVSRWMWNALFPLPI